ncbi:hypothetical protein CUN67_12955 [Pantoea cypripedii]|uniref:Uncharacterized protein n=2 Tax=Pantoea cypripedii TaxID=55209 RepID=A0A6B9G6A0_PANCY|nr:hypothetical protein CUN67_12955 [Pantoea cypripedii]
MNSQELFEKWYSGRRLNMTYSAALEVWEASRASIEIELPTGGYYCGYGCEHMMESRDVREAITEAGLKIKGES